MAECWSCGSKFPGGARYFFTCPRCAEVKETEGLRREVRTLAGITEQGFSALADGVAEVASIIEWGFQEVTWHLQQQTEVLRSIDQTLKNPALTGADELRRMAEELRARGVLDESERRFVMALESNPLDYRIYCGLGETLLRMGKFDEAETILQRSLPHAPKTPGKDIDGGDAVLRRLSWEQWHVLTYVYIARTKGESSPETEWDKSGTLMANVLNNLSDYVPFDFRSHSLRLIGHIHSCKEEYPNAVSALRSALQFSPRYWDGWYDYAQYCAQVGDRKNCLESLEKAIVYGGPLYYYQARKEAHFEPLRTSVDSLLQDIAKRTSDEAAARISDAESYLRQAREALSRGEESVARAKLKKTLPVPQSLNAAQAALDDSRNRYASGDYRQLLYSQSMAAQANVKARQARNEANAAADSAIRSQEATQAERWEDAKKAMGKCALYGSLFGFMVGLAVGGAVAQAIGVYQPHTTAETPGAFWAFLFGGAALGVICGALIGALFGYLLYLFSRR